MTDHLLEHLGGHDNITHTDEGALLFLRDECGIKSVLDVGCGPGGQVLLARRLGMEAEGIDGDWRLKEAFPDVILHDYAHGQYTPPIRWDAAWCVELLEHLEEAWLGNLFATLRRCSLIVMTHALPGDERSHHHVNCRTGEYWDWQFATRGFQEAPGLTERVRRASTMKREFMRTTGKVYRNGAWR